MKKVQLSKICEINPSIESGLDESLECSFVPMELIDEVAGEIKSYEVRLIRDVKKGYTYFRNGDILFAKITPCMENGKCAIAMGLRNGIGFGSTEFHVIRPVDGILSEWIYYYLRQAVIRKQAEEWFRGTAGQQRVPAQFLEELTIPLPPLDEQRRIAAILQRADRLRRLRRLSRQLSDTFLQSVFLQMFGSDSEYDIVSFEDVIKIDRIKAREDERRILPYIGLEHIEKQTGRLTSEFCNQPQATLATNYRFTRDHVLYGKLRPYLNKVIVPGFDGVCTTEIIPLLPRKGKIEKYFLWIYLRSNKFVDWASGNVAGANLPRISPELLKEHVLKLPPYQLQVKFSEFVIRINCTKKKEEESSRQSEQLFQTLLARAFSEI
ncbi:MAG TPA: restriction endonuclease subunit S [Anaerolineaceae bacterium]|nr:restriction endonuclease subunit S [Anaerolineaceae bacterium]